MRPIRTDPAPATYSEQAQLDHRVVLLEGTGSGKRRLEEAKEVTINSRLDAIETAIAQPRSRDDDIANMAKDLTGYEAATRPLITQTGPYCAFCEARVASDLRAEPVLPVTAYPKQLFAYDRLLLACPACRNARRHRPARGEAQSDLELLNPARFAWPHRYWQSLHDGDQLPFCYRLVLETPEGGTAVPLEDDLVHEYRSGRVWVERSESPTRGAVMLGPPPDQLEDDDDFAIRAGDCRADHADGSQLRPSVAAWPQSSTCSNSTIN